MADVGDHMDGLIAERDRLQAELGHAQTAFTLATNAADAGAEAVGAMAEKLRALLAERDRLRRALHESAGLEEKMAAVDYALRTVEEFDDLAAERDRLRVIARDVWAALWHAAPDDVELLSAEHEAMLPGLVRSTMLAAVEHNHGLSGERDRLRAVVDLVKGYRVQHGRFWVLENDEDEAVKLAERESQAWSKVVSALDALDGSAEATDG